MKEVILYVSARFGDYEEKLDILRGYAKDHNFKIYMELIDRQSKYDKNEYAEYTDKIEDALVHSKIGIYDYLIVYDLNEMPCSKSDLRCIDAYLRENGVQIVNVKNEEGTRDNAFEKAS